MSEREQPEAEQEQEQGALEDTGSGLRPLRPDGKWSKTYAYLYLTALVLLPVLAVLLGVVVGFVTLDVTVQASPDLSLALELLVTGFVVVLLFWTFVQVVRVTGIGFVQGIISAVARIADSYELPGEPPRRDEGDTE